MPPKQRAKFNPDFFFKHVMDSLKNFFCNKEDPKSK